MCSPGRGHSLHEACRGEDLDLRAARNNPLALVTGRCQGAKRDLVIILIIVIIIIMIMIIILLIVIHL